ncbi:hypothetical protein MRX96_053968 [Rhipicephalus microplus]
MPLSSGGIHHLLGGNELVLRGLAEPSGFSQNPAGTTAVVQCGSSSHGVRRLIAGKERMRIRPEDANQRSPCFLASHIIRTQCRHPLGAFIQRALSEFTLGESASAFPNRRHQPP